MSGSNQGLRMVNLASHPPPTVDDLTDVLDYGSEDIDGMDEEQGQDPPFTGRWTATSSYNVYMVDTPKGSDGDDKEEPDANKPSETQSRRRVTPTMRLYLPRVEA